MYSKSFLPALVSLLAMVTTAAACDAGSAPIGGVCAFCPAGTYAVAAANSCSRCALGFWAPINSVSAAACYPIAGTVPVVPGVPTGGCAAGSAPSNGACTFCPVGTYALASASQCTHCPWGFWAPINSVSKDACYPMAAKTAQEESMTNHCDAGSAPVDGVCTFCPVGTYALAGDASCTQCPDGWWAPINSVSDDACYPLVGETDGCDAGSAPINGFCVFCPVGTYALAGASECTHCPKGLWAPINSVSKKACYPLAGGPDHCDAGSAPVNGVCTFCPVGTYALANAKKCTACPEDYCAPINSVSKDACYLL